MPKTLKTTADKVNTAQTEQTKRITIQNQRALILFQYQTSNEIHPSINFEKGSNYYIRKQHKNIKKTPKQQKQT